MEEWGRTERPMQQFPPFLHVLSRSVSELVSRLWSAVLLGPAATLTPPPFPSRPDTARK